VSPRRTLTVGQLSQLRRLGEAVEHAGPGDRGPAVLLVVRTVHEYRALGASLPELARALSVEVMALRDWLDQHTPKPTQPSRSGTTGGIWSMSIRPAPNGSGVLACTGDGRPGGNDFAPELKIIRDRVQPRFVLTERTMVEVAELPYCIDGFRPQIVHIAAHSRDGAVFLTRSGEPVSVLHGHLVRTLLSARHRPRILVLNFCRSIAVGAAALQIAPAVVCWPDGVDDVQCRELADLLYQGLVGGDSLGASMDRARMTLFRHGELGLPHQFGDATARLR